MPFINITGRYIQLFNLAEIKTVKEESNASYVLEAHS